MSVASGGYWKWLKIIRVELRALQRSGIPLRVRIGRSCKVVVQSLNSPFFLLHIGAEPVRAKKGAMGVHDNLHAHAQNAAICLPQIGGGGWGGGKPYLEVLSRFGLWRDNIQATISASRLVKNM